MSNSTFGLLSSGLNSILNWANPTSNNNSSSNIYQITDSGFMSGLRNVFNPPTFDKTAGSGMNFLTNSSLGLDAQGAKNWLGRFGMNENASATDVANKLGELGYSVNTARDSNGGLLSGLGTLADGVMGIYNLANAFKTNKMQKEAYKTAIDNAKAQEKRNQEIHAMNVHDWAQYQQAKQRTRSQYFGR